MTTQCAPQDQPLKSPENLPNDGETTQIVCLHFASWSILRRTRQSNRRQRESWVRRRDETTPPSGRSARASVESSSPVSDNGPAINTAVVIVATTGSRRQIVEASPGARDAGVAVGMSAAEGRALCPGLICLPQESNADEKTLLALGRWLTRFTPIVAVGWSDEVDPALAGQKAPTARAPTNRAPATGTRATSARATSAKVTGAKAGRRGGRHADPAGEGKTFSSESAFKDGQTPGPAVIFLDITGCQRLFGSTRQLLRRLTGALDQLGLPASVAVAPTPGAAWAVASTTPKPTASPASQQRIIRRGELPTVLTPLPIGSLRLSDQIIAALHHLGVYTIGQLMQLPRTQIPARFGTTLLARLDQAIGNRHEPLIPLDYDPPVQAGMLLDAPATSFETIFAIFKLLLEQVVDHLTRRGRGARQLELVARFDPANRREPVIKTVSVTRPSRDVATLFGLIRLRLENLDGGREGFVSFAVHVTDHEPLAHEQTQFLADPAPTTRAELDRLAEQLTAKFSGDAVVRPVLVESHLPEQAWRPEPVQITSQNLKRSTSKRSSRTTPIVISNASDTCTPKNENRPLTLLSRPVEIGVVCEPSHQRIGRPRQFTWGRDIYRLTQIIGPERISGQWWRGHYRTRDYYEVEETLGRRFWLFRVIRHATLPINEQNHSTSVRWFLHGCFCWLLIAVVDSW